MEALQGLAELYLPDVIIILINHYYKEFIEQCSNIIGLSQSIVHAALSSNTYVSVLIIDTKWADVYNYIRDIAASPTNNAIDVCAFLILNDAANNPLAFEWARNKYHDIHDWDKIKDLIAQIGSYLDYRSFILFILNLLAPDKVNAKKDIDAKIISLTQRHIEIVKAEVRFQIAENIRPICELLNEVYIDYFNENPQMPSESELLENTMSVLQDHRFFGNVQICKEDLIRAMDISREDHELQTESIIYLQYIFEKEH
jgi:hypothetical protein